MSHQHEKLIQQILNCALACEDCQKALLSDKDIAMLNHCITLARDCADICFLTVRLLQKDSPIGHQTIGLCEEICRLCAEECRKHLHVAHCEACRDTCQKCENACQEHRIMV